MHRPMPIPEARLSAVWRKAACGAAMLCAAQALGAAPVGWVFADDGRTKPRPDSVTVLRGEKAVPADSLIALEPCDRVALNKTGSRLLIKLVDGARVPLNDGARTFEVPCDTSRQRYSDAFSTAVESFVPPDRGSGESEIAATRGSGHLEVLGLGAYDPNLVEGRRSLFIAWSAGTPPFKVSLTRGGVAAATSASAAEVNRRSVDLPAADLVPGRYVLMVSDANGELVTENDIHVVKASARPIRSPSPKDVDLDKVEQGLLDALSLEWHGAGEWRLEALQAMAALPRDDPRVKAWLLRFGVQ